jgi:hypothetical protein
MCKDAQVAQMVFGGEKQPKTPGAGGDCCGTSAPFGMNSGAGGTGTLPTVAAAPAKAEAALPYC